MVELVEKVYVYLILAALFNTGVGDHFELSPPAKNPALFEEPGFSIFYKGSIYGKSIVEAC
mgnify:CR=1 FL=1